MFEWVKNIQIMKGKQMLLEGRQTLFIAIRIGNKSFRTDEHKHYGLVKHLKRANKLYEWISINL